VEYAEVEREQQEDEDDEPRPDEGFDREPLREEGRVGRSGSDAVTTLEKRRPEGKPARSRLAADEDRHVGHPPERSRSPALRQHIGQSFAHGFQEPRRPAGVDGCRWSAGLLSIDSSREAS
jgi:hypothetical protein